MEFCEKVAKILLMNVEGFLNTKAIFIFVRLIENPKTKNIVEIKSKEEAIHLSFKGKYLTTAIAKRTATNTAAKIIPNNPIFLYFFNRVKANLQFFFNEKNFYL
mgnify:CR=1 FL=1